MAEGDRLCDLEMGEAGHDGAGVAFGLIDERRLERRGLAIEPVDRVAHPEAEIGRHLVVARACGVKTAGRRTDHLPEPRLDIEVDILMLGAEGEVAALDLGADLL